jgi:hypothetical protein
MPGVNNDDGQTWSYYPPDGVNSADITGGSSGVGNGAFYIFYGGAANFTINGLKLHNFQYGGIASLGGMSNAVFQNNEIYNEYYVPGAAASPGGITCANCLNTHVTHNYIHNTAAWAVKIDANVSHGIDNLLVDYNYVQNNCTGIADCGALYSWDGLFATSTNVRYLYNYVRDGNTFATLGSNAGEGIYADDCMSNMTASGNIVAGRNGSNTFITHGGNNVHYNSNIVDLATYARFNAIYQTSPGTPCVAATMSGNQYQGNIIISGGGGGDYGLLSGAPANPPAISNNVYHQYAGAAISSGTVSPYVDSNPVSEDPQLNCWTYAITAGSPVFNSPVSFPAQPAGWGAAGFWGPPGFVVPHTGTVPSSPHAC